MTHSITNSEIYKLAASKLTVQGVDIPCINGVLAFADALIELAQQTKPLVWYRRNTGWHTATDFGIYLLDEIDFDYRIKLVETPIGSTEMIAHRINGMDNAKDVAQQDYNRRVLSCLVWGVV